MIAPSATLSRYQVGFFYLFALLCLGCIVAAFQLNVTYMLAAPAVLLIAALGAINYRMLYYLLLAMLPCSVEYEFPNGLGTDLPTEPLMIGLMVVTLALLFYRKEVLPNGFFIHPLIVAVMAHLFWILICAINSGMPVFSYKIFVAKLWYFLPFTVLTTILVRRGRDLKLFFWSIATPLSILIVISIFRHGILYHFSFLDINKAVAPYFRNHVNYAAMLSIFFPFILLAISWYPSGSRLRRLLMAMAVLFVLGIYLSYTRTAYLALLAMIPCYIMIRLRLTKVAVLIFVLAGSLGVLWLLHDNHYMRFAPTFEETVYHDDLSSHLNSTLQGKDVSSMERVYRWVAAIKMSRDRPWMGVGSGNFYNYYKSYTLTDFETYVSDNEERSTVHNYYLLMLVEQGWIGFVIFLGMMLLVFLYSEIIYGKKTSRQDRNAVMTVILVMISIIVNLLLSDMMETDKVGPFFFLCIGLLVLFDRGVLTMTEKVVD